MAGYLDHYGAGEERRERYLWRTIVTLAAVLFLSALFYYLLKNHRQESVAKNFLAEVRKQDYQAAYRTWGCGDASSCRGYSYDKFLEDWGPKSSAAGQNIRLVDSEGCGQGVILTLEGREEHLWADKGNNALSFSPYPRCPGKSAFVLMMHHLLAPLRKLFY